MRRRVPRAAPRVVLRVAALGLLAQGAFSWGTLLGVAQPGLDFDTLVAAARNLHVFLAVACPVAALGAWFASDWGPVIWALVVIGLGVAVGAPGGGAWIAPAFAAHGLALLAWSLLALAAERRGDESRFG